MSFASVSDQIARHGQASAGAQAQKPALVESGRSLTHAQLGSLVDRVAASLQRDGVQAGDAVALCAASTLECAVATLGVLRCGGVVVPLPTSATAQMLAGLLADCDARLLWVDAEMGALLESADLAPALLRVVLDRLPDDATVGSADGAHAAERGASINAREPAAGVSPMPSRLPATLRPRIGTLFSGWLAPAGSAPAPVAVQPDARFNIIYSSGTTGAPKGIVHPHSLRNAQVARAANLGYGADSVTLLATPLYSNLTLTGFYPTLALGGTVVLLPRFDAAEYLRLAQAFRATQTVLVPVQYRRILDRPDFDAFDLSAFVTKIGVGAPFAAELKAELLRRWPGGLVDLYGLTEGGGTCVLKAHEHPDKLHTVGRPVAGHEVRVIDEQGQELAAGQTGEVVGHSPIMMLGYHKLPGPTQAAEWHDASGKRFIRTGDVGRFDADGFLVLVDRKKDMIISGGFNIYPSDIEAVLQQHPDVAECSVIGVPSLRWGETPAAFVVFRPGAASDAAACMQWLNARVGKTQRVSTLQAVDSLPRSPVGKVLKRELRDGFRREHGAAGDAA